MQSARGSTVYSVDDLMAMSPRGTQALEPADVASDLLTGEEFDSVCDITTRSNKRGRESWFIKFDPLLDSTEADTGYETGSAASIFADNSVAIPKHSMSAGSITLTWKKPTQVVKPVINDVPKTTEVIATQHLVQSASAILSSSHVATDRFISFIRSISQHRSNTHQVDRLQHEALLLRQENADLKSVVKDLESKVKKLTDERYSLIEKESQLHQQLEDKHLCNRQMIIVLEEYDKTLTNIIDKHQQEQLLSQEMQQKLTAEKDQTLSHISSMESSFNDCLDKYQKSISIIMEYKERQQLYEKKISEYESSLKNFKQRYSNLNQVSIESMATANETLASVKKHHSMELTKLNATIKKHGVKISSLEESLTQKTNETAELMEMCDQLIHKVH